MTKFPNFTKLTKFLSAQSKGIRHPELVEGSVPSVAAVDDRRSSTPTGLKSYSPGLARSAYPGSVNRAANPVRVEMNPPGGWATKRSNPYRVENFCALTQGSGEGRVPAATLGYIIATLAGLLCKSGNFGAARIELETCMTTLDLARFCCIAGGLAFAFTLPFSFTGVPANAFGHILMVIVFVGLAIYVMATILLLILDFVILARTWQSRDLLQNLAHIFVLLGLIFIGPYIGYFLLRPKKTELAHDH